MLVPALALALVGLLASRAAADRCSDLYPGGAPAYTLLQKTRFDIEGGVRNDSVFGSLAAAPIWHPHVEAGLRVTYAHAWRDTIRPLVELLAEARVSPLMVFGGLGTNGVCGMKGRQWRGGGAPYLTVGLGGWMDTAADDSGFAAALAIGWDHALGRRLSVFVQGGRLFATGREDAWTLGAGLRL